MGLWVCHSNRRSCTSRCWGKSRPSSRAVSARVRRMHGSIWRAPNTAATARSRGRGNAGAAASAVASNRHQKAPRYAGPFSIFDEMVYGCTLVPTNSFPSRYFSISDGFIPLMIATSSPSSSAFRAATGSKGEERPGFHSVGISFRN